MRSTHKSAVPVTVYEYKYIDIPYIQSSLTSLVRIL